MSQLKSYRLTFGKHYRMERGVMKCYKKGDVIKMTPESAENIKEKLDMAPSPEPLIDVQEAKEPTKVVKLQIKELGGGNFNVFNPETGKNVNSKPLTKEEAEELISGQEGD